MRAKEFKISQAKKGIVYVTREELAEAYAKQENKELREFALWLTGCGYDFTQHEYFMRNSHLVTGEQTLKK